jgi:hypothetical protein
MPRRPIGDKAMNPAERQRRRRRRLGIDGVTVRFAKAVQNALRYGLTEPELHTLVTTGAVRYRDYGLVTETMLARALRDGGAVTPSAPATAQTKAASAAGEPAKRDRPHITKPKRLKRDRPHVTKPKEL